MSRVSLRCAREVRLPLTGHNYVDINLLCRWGGAVTAAARFRWQGRAQPGSRRRKTIATSWEREKTMPVTPYLFFNGRCEEAVEFYKKALGAEVGMMMRFKENPDKPPPGMVPDGS